MIDKAREIHDELVQFLSLFFIHLIKLKHKLTKEDIEALDNFRKYSKLGIKALSTHYTLGRYDVVVFTEAPDEKAALAASFDVSDIQAIETLVAIPREEALKAVGLR